MEDVSATELAAWRAGTERAGWIHSNAAGASPSPPVVHDAVLRHLELERDVGGYAAAARYSGTDAHDALAALLGCDASEIALAESAQRAWCLALHSLEFRAGRDRILCFSAAYAGNAVRAAIRMARTFVPAEES